MKHLVRIVCLAVFISLWATCSYAIPASYGVTTHNTTDWQDISDVSWKVDGGAWGQNSSITGGSTIQFQTTIHKSNLGTHYYDLTKMWVDWGQDGQFDNPADEVLFGMANLQSDANWGTNGGSRVKPHTEYYTFTSSSFDISTLSGEFWLRSRVTCNTSMPGVSHSNQGDLTFDSVWYNEHYFATGYLGQGETEDYMFSTTPAPEPATIALLGLGMVGLAGAEVRRRRKKKVVDNS